jgi:hypothetical protein
VLVMITVQVAVKTTLDLVLQCLPLLYEVQGIPVDCSSAWCILLFSEL